MKFIINYNPKCIHAPWVKRSSKRNREITTGLRSIQSEGTMAFPVDRWFTIYPCLAPFRVGRGSSITAETGCGDGRREKYWRYAAGIYLLSIYIFSVYLDNARGNIVVYRLFIRKLDTRFLNAINFVFAFKGF